MAKLFIEEFIYDIQGVCTNKSCTNTPLVTKLTAGFHASHSESVISREECSSNHGYSIAKRLYSDHPAILDVIKFIKEQEAQLDLEEFALRSLAKKDLEIDDLFDNFIQYFTKEILEMKNNMKHHCILKQKEVIRGYLDSLKSLYKENYDPAHIEKILKQDSCRKSSQEELRKYLGHYHSSSRKKVDRILVGLFQLLDTSLSFGEVPEIAKMSKMPLNTLNIQSHMVESVKTHISNMMSFNVFSSLIKESHMYPIQIETFNFEENLSTRINTNDNGWLSGLVAFPPISLMHQVGDSRLPLMYNERGGILNNAIALASTEGNVSIWGTTGKLREIFREGKLINALLAFPPLPVPRQEDEDYSGPDKFYALVASFWMDHVTLWDLNTLERHSSTRLAHEHFLSAGVIYPYRTETSHPYYKHLGKIVNHKYCLVTTGADLTLKVWSVPDLKPMKTIMNVNKTMLAGLALVAYDYKEIPKSSHQGLKGGKISSLTKEGRRFYLVAYEKEIKTWDIERNLIVKRYNHQKPITSLVVIDCSSIEDPYASVLKESKKQTKSYYIFSSDNSIYIMSFPEHKLIKRIADAHEGVIRKLELLYMKIDGGEQKLYLASIGIDKTIKIWNWRNAKCVKVLKVAVKCDGPTMARHEVFDGNLRKQIIITAGRSLSGQKIMNIFSQ